MRRSDEGSRGRRRQRRRGARGRVRIGQDETREAHKTRVDSGQMGQRTRIHHLTDKEENRRRKRRRGREKLRVVIGGGSLWGVVIL